MIEVERRPSAEHAGCGATAPLARDWQRCTQPVAGGADVSALRMHCSTLHSIQSWQQRTGCYLTVRAQASSETAG